MTLEQKMAALFRMDDEARKRHSNPWSVYSRFSMVPLLALAFWSRAWLGIYALIPISLVLLWVWLNPRIFPAPKSTDHWASKVVLGEWVWMNRKNIQVPAHHARLPNILSIAGAMGVIPFAWGLYALQIWPTILGGVMIVLSKLWFADRMVWLYEDMKSSTPEYRSWFY